MMCTLRRGGAVVLGWLFMVAVSLLAASACSAQSVADLAGVILGENGQPVASVEVRLSSGDTAVTDQRGRYVFHDLAVGEVYVLSPAAAGHLFRPAEQQVKLNGGEQTVNFQSELTEWARAVTASSALLTSGLILADVTGDAYEVDDSDASAKEIAAGEVQQRSIHVVTDEDWVHFQIAEESQVVIETDGLMGDTYLLLVQAAPGLPVIDRDDDGGRNMFSRIEYTGDNLLEAGEYYIVVHTPNQSSTIPAYRLSLWVAAPQVDHDAYEPDDTSGEAKVIADGETQQRSIHPGENEDWAQFTITERSEARIWTDGPRPEDDDTELYLYDSEGTQLEYNDDRYDQEDSYYSLIECSEVDGNILEPGTYYILAHSYNHEDGINEYTLSLQLSPVPVAAADSYEPDDSLEAAQPIADGETQQRSIHLQDNDDWATFTVTEVSEVWIWTDGPRPDYDDTELYLYDSEGTELEYNDDRDDDENSYFSMIARTVSDDDPLQPGTYYINVESYNHGSQIPEYSLSLVILPVLIGEDSYEPDDTPQTATEIAPGETVHNIHEVDDEDWAQFTLTAASEVVIWTDGLYPGDTELYLYDSGILDDPDAAEVEYNDDDELRGGYFSRIECTGDAVLHPGTYFIRVISYDHSGLIGRYSLHLSVEPLPGGTPDMYEEDDTAENAKPIRGGEVQNRTIHLPANQDWATFTLLQQSDVLIDTAGPRDQWTDTKLYLYDSEGTQLGYDDDSGRNGCSCIKQIGLAPGTYYAMAESYHSDVLIPDYSLALTVLPQELPEPDAYEADDSSGAAKPIADGDEQLRSIHAIANLDWATFTLDRPSAVTIASTENTELFLHDGAGALVEHQEGDGSLCQIGGTDYFLPAGIYYILARKWMNNGLIEAYTLSLDVQPFNISGPDQYENDDTSTTARLIASGDLQEHNIHVPGNEDWAAFTLDAPSEVTIQTAPPVGPNGSVGGIEGLNDTVLCLYDSSGSLIESDDDDGPDSYAAIERTGAGALPAGTYFIRVTASTPGWTIPNYALSLTVVVLSAAVPDAYEVDNSSATAKAIAGGDSQQHSIHAPGDVDWATFSLPCPADVTAWTSGTSGNTRMWLYRGNGSLVEYDDDDGTDQFSRIERTGGNGLPAGVYLIKVNSAAAGWTIPAYQLNLDIAARPLPDAYEVDDTSAGARIIGVGSTQNRSIHAVGNVDWAKFTLSATRQVTITSTGDTELRLYSAAGALLGTGPGNGTVAEIIRTGGNALPAGTYLVRVTERGNNAVVPSYSLSLAASE